jgi:hypothetical protein
LRLAPYRPLCLDLRLSPTGSYPALFRRASARLVSKP